MLAQQHKQIKHVKRIADCCTMKKCYGVKRKNRMRMQQKNDSNATIHKKTLIIIYITCTPSSDAYSIFEITLTFNFVHLSQKFRSSFSQRFFCVESIRLWYYGLMTRYTHGLVVSIAIAQTGEFQFKFTLSSWCFIFQKTIDANGLYGTFTHIHTYV